MKKQSSGAALAISPTLQRVFLFVIGFAWASESAFTLFQLWYRGYTNLGTRIFQMSYMVHPLLFFVVAILIIRRRYPQVLQRWFMSGLLGVMGIALFQIFSLVIEDVRNRFNWLMPDMASKSILNAFWFEWVLMLVGLIIFTVILLFFYRNNDSRRRSL